MGEHLGQNFDQIWVGNYNFMYSRSLIIGTLITVILEIPGLIKNSKFLDYRDFLLIIPCNTMIPIIKDWDFFYYRELFLDLVILIIKNLL